MLAGVVVCGMSVAGCAWAQEIRIGGTGGALGTMQTLANAYQKIHPEAKIVVLPSLGSGGGIKAVLAGAIQVAVSSRPLTPAETNQGATAVEHGRTPFVFAVRANTGPDNVTTKELAEIFSGALDRWPDGSTIRLVLRPVGDSDEDILKKISPEMAKAMALARKRPGMRFAITDQDAADAIEKIGGAFGATTEALIVSEKRAIKSLRLNGVEPSTRAVADGSYPYFKPLFIVTTEKPLLPARQFVAFLLSADGRAILARSGYAVR